MLVLSNLKNLLELTFLVLLLLVVNYFLVFKEKFMLGGLSFFESGFENQLWSKLSPSLHFFKIGLVFVLFDLEFLFLFLTFFQNSWVWLWILIWFMVLTLWLELALGSLDWTL